MNNKLCERCRYAFGKMTTKAGKLVCDGCYQSIDKKLETAPTRHCPVDQSELEKIVVNNVIIDRCKQCEGIWLDKDEVYALTSSLQDEFVTTKENGSGNFIKGLVTGLIIG